MQYAQNATQIQPETMVATRLVEKPAIHGQPAASDRSTCMISTGGRFKSQNSQKLLLRITHFFTRYD